MLVKKLVALFLPIGGAPLPDLQGLGMAQLPYKCGQPTKPACKFSFHSMSGDLLHRDTFAPGSDHAPSWYQCVFMKIHGAVHPSGALRDNHGGWVRLIDSNRKEFGHESVKQCHPGAEGVAYVVLTEEDPDPLAPLVLDWLERESYSRDDEKLTQPFNYSALLALFSAACAAVSHAEKPRPMQLMKIRVAKELERHRKRMASLRKSSGNDEPVINMDTVLQGFFEKAILSGVPAHLFPCFLQVAGKPVERAQRLLHFVVRHARDSAVLKALLETVDPYDPKSKVDVNEKDGSDHTALWIAVGAKNAEAVRLLLAHRGPDGAVTDLSLTDRHGKTAEDSTARSLTSPAYCANTNWIRSQLE